MCRERMRRSGCRRVGLTGAVLHRRWRGRPFGRRASAVALQGEAANHRKVRRLRAGVLSVAGKGAPWSASGVGREGERKRTTDDVSKTPERMAKPGLGSWPGISLGDTCLLPGCCPA